MESDPIDSITPELVKSYSDTNFKNVKNTINDLSFNSKKILVCGRGEPTHPDFSPRFTTPSTMIKSDLYVTVDHHPPKKNISQCQENMHYLLLFILMYQKKF